MKVNIGLSDQARKGATTILNKLLADEYLLYTQTRNYHWNVTGAHFNDLHKFFESQYEELNGIVDDVAERVRALGGLALGTLADFLANSRRKEEGGKLNAREMVRRLKNGHEEIIQFLRKDLQPCSDRYQDAGTGDFLTGIMEQHEKMAWMLRVMLEE